MKNVYLSRKRSVRDLFCDRCTVLCVARVATLPVYALVNQCESEWNQSLIFSLLYKREMDDECKKKKEIQRFPCSYSIWRVVVVWTMSFILAPFPCRESHRSCHLLKPPEVASPYRRRFYAPRMPTTSTTASSSVCVLEIQHPRCHHTCSWVGDGRYSLT